jgi:NitT/TauT family transport system permease protein
MRPDSHAKEPGPIREKTRTTLIARSKAARRVYPVISLALCLIAWQAVILIFRPSDYILPPPWLVVKTLVTRFDYLLGHAWVTAVEMVGGYALTVMIAVPLAVLIVSSVLAERLVFPILVTSQSVPTLALAPLLIVWFGFGVVTKIIVVILICFFPIVVNTAFGLKGVPTDMLDLGRTMGLRPVKLFFKIKLPYALPAIFAGLRVAASAAAIGAIIGEFVGANSGLGYLLMLASSQLQTALMFADLLVLVVMSLAFFGFILWLERILLPWHVSMRRGSTGA